MPTDSSGKPDRRCRDGIDIQLHIVRNRDCRHSLEVCQVQPLARVCRAVPAVESDVIDAIVLQICKWGVQVRRSPIPHKLRPALVRKEISPAHVSAFDKRCEVFTGQGGLFSQGNEHAYRRKNPYKAKKIAFLEFVACAIDSPLKNCLLMLSLRPVLRGPGRIFYR